MQKLNSSGLKTLDYLRNLSARPKILPLSSRPSPDAASKGSFGGLKLAADKLVTEQAAARSDVELVNLKLKKSADQIHTLEAKLHEVSHECTKLKAKQNEDTERWDLLESKLSSTKGLCDQLSETLHHLTSQVKRAEEDRTFFETRLSESSAVLEDLNVQLHVLSSKLKDAEERIQNGKSDFGHLKAEKEAMEKKYRDELLNNIMLISAKDASIKHLEVTIEQGKKEIDALVSKLHDAQRELGLKEDLCKNLAATKQKLEDDKVDLQCQCEKSELNLDRVSTEIKCLKEELHTLETMIVQIDAFSLATSKNVVLLLSSWEAYDKLVQEEKLLKKQASQLKYDGLHNQYLDITTENGVFQSEIEVLKNQIVDLRKSSDNLALKSMEEHEFAEQKIQNLEKELQFFKSKESEVTETNGKLEGKIEQLSSSLKKFQDQKQDLATQISNLESLNHDIQEKAESLLQNKVGEIEMLQEDIGKHMKCVESLETQVKRLQEDLDEKVQSELRYKDQVKELEEKKMQVQASLDASETSLLEAKKQYNLMLEGKQSELTKHLKEISLRNDQEINDIRRKYELEKQEIIYSEKEKANKLVEEMERKCDDKIKDEQEKAQAQLKKLQEDHDVSLKKIHLENSNKKSTILAEHDAELKRLELASKNELREITDTLRKEHEIQLKVLMHEKQDAINRLQDELQMQKTKEERQRTLLQLQWKVMSNNPEDAAEVNSKKEHSSSSIKIGGKEFIRGEPAAAIGINKTDGKLLGVPDSPVSSLMRKNKPGKLVTHREYEVRTSDGRTITKRKRTKSTVMFDNHARPKRMNMDGVLSQRPHPKTVMKGTGGGSRLKPASIGDLFRETSLDPYVDDPYAFD